MARRGTGPDFVEALARGLDVLSCFDERTPRMTLAEIATATDLARPTARRLPLTLQELGYVRTDDGLFTLTPRMLRLGMAYVGALGLWDIARPHLIDLVARTHESSSISQLDGSDIVYVARVSVPRLIALRVEIGTRFPALETSQGKILLAALDQDTLRTTLAEPSRSGLPPSPEPASEQVDEELTSVRSRGWALADEELAPGVRSIAVPVHDRTGAVRAAMNDTVHAAQTPMSELLDQHPPAPATHGRRHQRRLGLVADPPAARTEPRRPQPRSTDLRRPSDTIRARRRRCRRLLDDGYGCAPASWPDAPG